VRWAGTAIRAGDDVVEAARPGLTEIASHLRDSQRRDTPDLT
jgi:hypothetical protein